MSDHERTVSAVDRRRFASGRAVQRRKPASVPSLFRAIRPGGVKIYEYATTMTHSKTIAVDGLLSTMGSSNFDSRSAQIN
jgi:phosphatidylserine/phosphatidylglycerophosphate/cardiolipin synthase-like enzyme